MIKKIIKYLFLIISVSIMVCIFLFSGQSGKESDAVSGGFINTLLEFFIDGFKNAPSELRDFVISSYQLLFRKMAHFSIYSLLGFSLCGFFVLSDKLKIYVCGLFSAGISLIYSFCDEIHQLFIPGRSGLLVDVFIDFAGSILGTFNFILLFIFIKYIVHQKTKE